MAARLDLFPLQNEPGTNWAVMIQAWCLIWTTAVSTHKLNHHRGIILNTVLFIRHNILSELHACIKDLAVKETCMYEHLEVTK